MMSDKAAETHVEDQDTLPLVASLLEDNFLHSLLVTATMNMSDGWGTVRTADCAKVHSSIMLFCLTLLHLTIGTDAYSIVLLVIGLSLTVGKASTAVIYTSVVPTLLLASAGVYWVLALHLWCLAAWSFTRVVVYEWHKATDM